MSTISRISRLVSYFGRVKGTKALYLFQVQRRIQGAGMVLEGLRGQYASSNRLIVASTGEVLDVSWARIIEGYKAVLKNEMERTRYEMELLKKEEEAAVGEALEALRRERMWERVKERIEVDDKEKQTVKMQGEIDEMSMQRQSLRRFADMREAIS